MGDAASSTEQTEQRGLLSASWRRVRSGGPRLLGLLLAMQIVIVVICLPVFQWIFAEAVRAAGMTGLDLGALDVGPGLTVTVALLVILCLGAFWLVSIQFTVLVVALDVTSAGMPLAPRTLAMELRRVSRKLLRPSSAPVLLYLFGVLPLTGFGFASTLTQGIAIPPFVSGELLKSTAGALALLGFMIVLIFLNIRFCLTLPLFVLTDARGSTAMRTSWKLTRGFAVTRLVITALGVILMAVIVTAALTTAAIVPTVVSDALAPNASPFVAAYSLGAAQTLGFLLTALVTAMLVSLVMEYVERRDEDHARAHPLRRRAQRADAPDARRRGHRATTVLVVGALVVSATLGTTAISTLEHLSEQPETLVLAHRGFSDGGVENTLSGLDAAAAVGADLVEMDVMQTADGGFVAMHDANLSRLTGTDIDVKDLTLEEVTAMTATDAHGQSDRIPSFTEYVQHADRLGMSLLIEIKLGGADHEDLVDDLVAELEAIDALDAHIYHSLDAPSVARLKELRPDLSVGYTMAFAAVAPPETTADFIVVEEWTASDHLQRAAQSAGLGFMVWTVNTEEAQHTFFRNDVDGIITDHPDIAIRERAQISDETGLAETLLDLLRRFVIIF